MPKTATNTNTPALNDDTLWGTAAIGKAINRGPKAAHHLLASGQIPGGKIGGQWISSRAKLRQHIEALLADAVA
jgi:hypothetical protein